MYPEFSCKIIPRKLLLLADLYGIRSHAVNLSKIIIMKKCLSLRVRIPGKSAYRQTF